MRGKKRDRTDHEWNVQEHAEAQYAEQAVSESDCGEGEGPGSGSSSHDLFEVLSA